MVKKPQQRDRFEQRPIRSEEQLCVSIIGYCQRLLLFLSLYPTLSILHFLILWCVQFFMLTLSLLRCAVCSYLNVSGMDIKFSKMTYLKQMCESIIWIVKEVIYGVS